MLTGAVGFALSAAAVGTVELPLVCGLLLALEADWPTLLAAGMGALGAVTFWRGNTQAELLAGIVVCLLGNGIFAGSSFRKRPWFLPVLCGGVTVVLGLTFLLSQPEVETAELGLLLLRALGAAGSQMVFSRLRQRPEPVILAAAVGLTQLGLSQILVFRVVDLGFVAAGFLTCAGFGLPMTLCSALGADLSRITGVSVTAVLCLTHLVGKVSRRAVTVFLPGLLALAWGLAAGQVDEVLVLSLTVGSLAAVFVPRQQKAERHKTHPEEARLILAASTLEYLAEALSRQEKPTDEAALLFDEAAGRACTGCAKWRVCWQEQSGQTYCLLAGSVPELLETGKLPETFLARCRRADAFSQAVSQALTGLRLRRQYRLRLEESRKALSGQYYFLARFLRGLGDTPCGGRVRYTPEVAMGVRGHYGRGGNGDRAAWFAGVGGRYYIILCDGMGTGREAAGEGQRALELLSGMLKTGLEPEDALGTLNDFYVLRETGGFSTADILEIRLDTGRACLYKWGGAPSFIKRRNLVKQVGTAGPPPGMGIGEEHHPALIRLSMERGQTVALVSDGFAPKEVERIIASCDDGDPKTMVSALTSGGKMPGEDDCTAVAVCLTPLPPGSL